MKVRSPEILGQANGWHSGLARAQSHRRQPRRRAGGVPPGRAARSPAAAHRKREVPLSAMAKDVVSSFTSCLLNISALHLPAHGRSFRARAVPPTEPRDARASACTAADCTAADDAALSSRSVQELHRGPARLQTFVQPRKGRTGQRSYNQCQTPPVQTVPLQAVRIL